MFRKSSGIGHKHGVDNYYVQFVIQFKADCRHFVDYHTSTFCRISFSNHFYAQLYPAIYDLLCY